MFKLKGIAVNLEKPFLGKIDREYYFSLTEKKNDILSYLVKGKETKSYSDSICFITNSRKRDEKWEKKSLVYNLENIRVLRQGDVLFIEPDGMITVLYQKDRNDNSILITQRCNCNCLICPQPPIEDEEKDLFIFNRELIHLIDKKTRFLVLTGGEPTLKKKELLEILTECKKELPATALILLTNGIALEDLNYVRELISVHPNLTFAISLYSDVDNIHDRIVRNNCFYKVLKGIYNLALLKQRVEIRIVVNKLNYKRLPNFAEFISYNLPFIINVAFMGLEIIGCAYDNLEEVWIDPYDYQIFLKNAVQILHRHNLPVSIYNHPLCVLPPSLWKFSRDSISGWKKTYLSSCEPCKMRSSCGGLFSTSRKYSEHISALTEIDNFKIM